MQINQFSILEKEWGNIALELGYSANRYSIQVDMKGNNLSANANGFYEASENSSAFSIDFDLSKIELSLLEPILAKQVKNLKGIVTGNLTISGSIQEPTIRGKLTFAEVSALPTLINSPITLKNESIYFQPEGIVFRDFKLMDEKSNVATINGSILTKAYTNFDFNLQVTSRNFLFLNTTEKDNELYYGTVRISTNARITGNMNQPRINMTVSLGEGSQITYVVPASEKDVLEQKGIVQFVNKRTDHDPFLTNLALPDTTQSMFKGVDVTANLELTDKSTLNIVIDPSTGDQLSLKGNSTLLYNSEANGNMNLSGRYEITSGTYNFSFYQMVKREFDLVSGSSITWSGDPLNASMDLRARFDVEASPLDLVYNQINTSNQSEVNAYNLKLPFMVYLDIKGRLLVPEISFLLDMPDDKRNAFGGAIYAKLQDINTRESDLNKQVFALLILKRFISENPFESQASSSVGNTTRVSVSRMLSEQLNRLSENVKGVQLSVDLRSYETNTGNEVQGETRVQLGVSKNLFNDRLVVKLSGNVDIEGESSNQNTVTDYIGDLALEYKLTSDGRFRITGFRTSNFDMIDGELIETGTGLIYIKDYNTLRELLRPNAKSE